MSLLLSSAGFMKPAAVAGYTPQWVQFPASGNASLHRSTGIGGSTGTTQMTRVYAVNAPDFTSGAYVLANKFSTDTPWKDTTNVGYMLVDCEHESNARTFYGGSNSVSANTDYLVMASYDGSAGTGSIAIIDIATGTTYTPTPSTILSGQTMDFALNDWVIGATNETGTNQFRGKIERVQQWVGLHVDVTSSTVQDYFYDSTNNLLLDPATAIAQYPNPLVSISDGDLLTGTNAGTGGDFTVNGTLT